MAQSTTRRWKSDKSIVFCIISCVLLFDKKLYKKLLPYQRADIIRCYEKYSERGFCPIYARDALELEYEAYHNLGANGTITQLMDRLRVLPTDSAGGKD